MKYESIEKLMEETHGDLVSIANSEFNLGVNKSFKKEELARMILTVQNSGQVRSEDVEVLRGERAKNIDAEEVPEGYCILRLQKGRGNPSGWPVTYGLQGRVGILPVNKSFKAPEYIIEVLSNAMLEEIVKDRDQDEEVVTKTYAYPFTVLKHNPSKQWPKIEHNINLQSMEESFA